MSKLGMNQTIAWIAAVFGATSIMGGGYIGMKLMGQQRFSAKLKTPVHHEEPAHGEDKSHGEENSHGDDKSHGEQASHAGHDAKAKNNGETAQGKSHGDDTADKKDEKKSHSHWGYFGPQGPTHWAGLDSAYEQCTKGKGQSPIDLRGNGARHEQLSLEVHYRKERVEIVNNGHTIQGNYPPGSYMMFKGHRYELMQFHFHTPSEHTVGGNSYPLEMHLVHKDEDGKLAVIGVLFEKGPANENLTSMFNDLPSEIGKKTELAGFNAAKVIPNLQSFYHYQGSLTTPPCSEGVTWIVLQDKRTISKRQLGEFSKIIPFNARPVQSLHTRALFDVDQQLAH